MPIHCPVTISCLDSEEFERLDYRVMGHAYNCQKALSRPCDEGAYQADLKARLRRRRLSLSPYENSNNGHAPRFLETIFY